MVFSLFFVLWSEQSHLGRDFRVRLEVLLKVDLQCVLQRRLRGITELYVLVDRFE
jgi:hypothetical protein